MSILVIFITGKQNGGYHRKLPASLHAVSFIGGGNRSAKRKPSTCCKSLTNFYHIMLHRVHFAMNRVQTHNISGDRH